MWRMITKAPWPDGVLGHAFGATGALFPPQTLAWLRYTPQEEVRPWVPPSDTGWAMMSDVGSFRAGVPEALVHWRRARGETQPDPMI